ncbi:hypothetical protein C8J56DRAFT_1034908 [Mycena floridula]|nr:hypothetical protein C8J56DRAFT_1034908 [Mycena floridula]
MTANRKLKRNSAKEQQNCLWVHQYIDGRPNLSLEGMHEGINKGRESGARMEEGRKSQLVSFIGLCLLFPLRLTVICLHKKVPKRNEKYGSKWHTSSKPPRLLVYQQKTSKMQKHKIQQRNKEEVEGKEQPQDVNALTLTSYISLHYLHQSAPKSGTCEQGVRSQL